MRVAICEDDRLQAGWLEESVRGYFEKNGGGVDIVRFDSGFSLVEHFEQGASRIDLVLLDIVMPGMSGIEAAHAIREVDEQVPIILTTSSREYALDAFGIEAMAYLIKPVDRNKLYRQLDKLCAQRRREEGELSIHSRRKVYRVPLHAVCYIEKADRKTVVYLHDGRQLECFEAVKQFKQRLAQCPQFISPHQSYLVNMDYVVLVDQARREVEMQGGAKIPVARDRLRQMLDAMIEKLGGEL